MKSSNSESKALFLAFSPSTDLHPFRVNFMYKAESGRLLQVQDQPRLLSEAQPQTKIPPHVHTQQIVTGEILESNIMILVDRI